MVIDLQGQGNLVLDKNYSSPYNLGVGNSRIGNFVANRNLYNLNTAGVEQLKADTFVRSSDDDGYIPLGEKLLNFAKGVVSPVTSMFSSVKNFAIGAGMIAGGAALIAATGGAAAPVMVAAGLGFGGYNVVKGACKAYTAETDDEARQAWQSMGAGTTSIGLSVAGAKAALNKAGVAGAKDMGVFKASWECVKNTRKMVVKSCQDFSLGKLWASMGFGQKTKELAKTETKSEFKMTAEERARNAVSNFDELTEAQKKRLIARFAKDEMRGQSQTQPAQSTEAAQPKPSRATNPETKPAAKQTVRNAQKNWESQQLAKFVKEAQRKGLKDAAVTRYAKGKLAELKTKVQAQAQATQNPLSVGEFIENAKAKQPTTTLYDDLNLQN